MQKAILGVALSAPFGALNLSAQSPHVFKGEICVEPGGRAAVLEKGQATAQCTVTRPKRGARYVLSNLENQTVYQLDGRKPKNFAGNKVVVVGTLDDDTRTIYVDEMFRALPPKVAQSKTIYIDCDACPRGMAEAWLAAFEGLTDWGRFDIIPDPKKDELVFLFSANPYLGDYVTRDGPDKRPVRVDITYMDVVDPLTGESLWGDSRRWGSLLVARATKDLIGEFKDEMELEEKF